MNNLIGLLVLSLCLLDFVVGGSLRLARADPVAAEPNVPSMREVVAAWEARTKTFHSGRFAWKQTTFLRQGALMPADDSDNATRKPIPSVDRTDTYTVALQFDGTRTRYESKGPQWNPHSNEFTDQRYVGTWNGVESRAFRPDEGYPRGVIRAEAFDAKQHALLPFKLACRTLTQEWGGLDPADFSVLPETTVVGDQLCVVVETSRQRLDALIAAGRRPWKQTLWLSVRQGYSVVRYAETIRGMTLVELDIGYKEDSQVGWYPVHWVFSSYGYGQLGRVDETVVTEASINPSIAPEEFELRFPEGAWVRDGIRQQAYIVRASDLRSVTDEELTRGAGYEDLLSSESGQALLPARRGSNWGRFGVIGAAMLVVVLLIVWRQMARRRGLMVTSR